MSNTILRAAAAVALIVILPGSSAAKAKALHHIASRRLPLHVSWWAGVPPHMLDRARREVRMAFEPLGVEVNWIGCERDAAQRHQDRLTSPDAIRVAVVSRESRAFDVIPASVLGAVVRDDESRETAWVLFDRIERAADRYALDAGLVLGRAIAHEVGHLLLPRGTHGPAGIMRATWRAEDLRDAVQGRLMFSDREADIIRARLE